MESFEIQIAHQTKIQDPNILMVADDLNEHFPFEWFYSSKKYAS